MSWWFLFLCTLQYNFIANTEAEIHNAVLGSDVTLSCEVSSLPESSTLQWERVGGPTPNTTLFYNNTAFLLLYNVNHASQGNYFYKIKDQLINKYLNVTQNTYKADHILYRAVLNNSEVSLICQSTNMYNIVSWTLQSDQQNTSAIVTATKGKNGSFPNMRFSTRVYDGFSFPLHIKHVIFEDSGVYMCYVKKGKVAFTTIWLRTVRVSAEPPGGVYRNQSVVLTCEVSEVTDPVTLAWLRMEGGRGLLVKQEVLTKRGNKSLSVTVNSVSEEQLLWQCAVFSNKTLRSLVPVALHLLPEEGSNLLPVVAMASAGVLGVCIFAALVFYRNRNRSEKERIYSTAPVDGRQQGTNIKSYRGHLLNRQDILILYPVEKPCHHAAHCTESPLYVAVAMYLILVILLFLHCSCYSRTDDI